MICYLVQSREITLSPRFPLVFFYGDLFHALSPSERGVQGPCNVGPRAHASSHATRL